VRLGTGQVLGTSSTLSVTGIELNVYLLDQPKATRKHPTTVLSRSTGLAVSFCPRSNRGKNDWVGIFKTNETSLRYIGSVQYVPGPNSSSPDAEVELSFTAPTERGEYEMRYVHHNGNVLAVSQSFAIRGPTITPLQNEVFSGSPIDVQCEPVPNRSGDWVALYTADLPKFISYLKVPTADSWDGLLQFKDSNAAVIRGEHTFKYHSSAGAVLETSSPVLVEGPTLKISNVSAHQSKPDSDELEFLVRSGLIKVDLKARANRAGRDWLGMYLHDEPSHKKYLETKYVAAPDDSNSVVSLEFQIPSSTGKHEVRYLNPNYDCLATSIVFNVRGPKFLETPRTWFCGHDLELKIEVLSTGAKGDWLGLYSVSDDNKPLSKVKLPPTSEDVWDGKVRFESGATCAGSYVVRYHSADNSCLQTSAEIAMEPVDITFQTSDDIVKVSVQHAPRGKKDWIGLFKYQGEETTNTIKSPFQKVEVTARTEACSNPMDDTMSVEFDIPAAITESTFQFRYVFSDRHVIGKSAQWTETEGVKLRPRQNTSGKKAEEKSWIGTLAQVVKRSPNDQAKLGSKQPSSPAVSKGAVVSTATDEKEVIPSDQPEPTEASAPAAVGKIIHDNSSLLAGALSWWKGTPAAATESQPEKECVPSTTSEARAEGEEKETDSPISASTEPLAPAEPTTKGTNVSSVSASSLVGQCETEVSKPSTASAAPLVQAEPQSPEVISETTPKEPSTASKAFETSTSKIAAAAKITTESASRATAAAASVLTGLGGWLGRKSEKETKQEEETAPTDLGVETTLASEIVPESASNTAKDLGVESDWVPFAPPGTEATQTFSLQPIASASKAEVATSEVIPESDVLQGQNVVESPNPVAVNADQVEPSGGERPPSVSSAEKVDEGEIKDDQAESWQENPVLDIASTLSSDSAEPVASDSQPVAPLSSGKIIHQTTEEMLKQGARGALNWLSEKKNIAKKKKRTPKAT